MPTEEIPTHYCRRIQSQVRTEKSYDITGRIIISCQHYTHLDSGSNRNPCIKDSPRFKKCLVKLAVQKEEKSKLVS
jgi:hypothetical protein